MPVKPCQYYSVPEVFNHDALNLSSTCLLTFVYVCLAGAGGDASTTIRLRYGYGYVAILALVCGIFLIFFTEVKIRYC